MFRHTDHLQFDARPDKPDPVYAHKLQELIGGAYGEMTVTMQYLFQGWNCRMPGKYKDLIMDIATEEIGHVEMIATIVAGGGSCWLTPTVTRGTAGTSWPAAICWPTSAPTPPPRPRGGCRPPGCTT